MTGSRRRLLFCAASVAAGAAALAGAAHAEARAVPMALVAPPAIHQPLEEAQTPAPAQTALPAAKSGWAALALAAVAALIVLLGPKALARRIREAAPHVADAAVGAARAAAHAPAAAVRVVGRAARAPLRWLAVVLGISFVVIAGAATLHAEWLFGVGVGALATGVVWFGWRRLARGLVRRRATR